MLSHLEQTEELALNPHPVPGTKGMAVLLRVQEEVEHFHSALGWSVYLLTGPGPPERRNCVLLIHERGPGT